MTTQRASIPPGRLEKRRSSKTENSPLSQPQPKPELPWLVEMVALSCLRPAKRNARAHSAKQIRQIANSIGEFDAIVPIVADDRGTIVAGHGRFAAAQLLQRTHFPVIRVSHLSESQIRAYALADNKLAENAGWDRELLNIELRELQIALPEIGLNLDITGFSPGDVDSIMLDFADEQPKAADVIPRTETKIVAKTGDVFVLGRHRLLVGDSRKEQDFQALMGSEKAEMAFLTHHTT